MTAPIQPGRPPPALTWRRRELPSRVIDDSYLTLNDFVALQRWSRARVSSSSSSSSEGGSSKWPEKRSATDVERQHDNNWARSTPMADSINSQTSAGREGVEHWRNWPEYSYYLAKRAPATNWFKGDREKGEQLNEELSAANDDNLETAVNVLQLSNLPHSLEGQIELAMNATNPDLSRPEFECQASNLHYDLHALIKLYAPSSLAGRATNPILLGESEGHDMAESTTGADWQVSGGPEPEQAAALWSASQLAAPVGLRSATENRTEELEHQLLRGHRLATLALSDASQNASALGPSMLRSGYIGLEIFSK